jgi:tight adherence protein C
MRLLAGITGALLLVAALRCSLQPRRAAGSRRPVVVRALGAAALQLTPRAATVRLLERPGQLRAAARHVALIGDLGLAGATLHAAAHEDPVTALPGLRLTAAGLGLVTALTATVLAGPTVLPIAVGLPIAAALAPDLALSRTANSVQATVSAALPDVLDLLASCARAGRPLELSLALAADHSPAPLAALLRRAVSRQAVGQGPAAALRLEAERTGVDSLVSLAALVERNRELGLPLEAPLLHLADAARAEARIGCLARAGRTVPLAGVLTALVIAPACVAGLATAVLGGMLAGGVL